ncbi:hypothetical protein Q7P37_001341 [Cladosporium fusiforme]
MTVALAADYCADIIVSKRPWGNVVRYGNMAMRVDVLSVDMRGLVAIGRRLKRAFSSPNGLDHHRRTITLASFSAAPSTTPRRHGPSHVASRMPRRKAADRDQPHKRRSRNGCLNCKRRKIRCDEGTPACAYCTARNLTCSRGGLVLKWETDYADSGLAFGRQGVWSKNGKSKADESRIDQIDTHWLPLPNIEACHFVNDSSEPFDESENALILRSIGNAASRSHPSLEPGVGMSPLDFQTWYNAATGPGLSLSNLSVKADPRHGHLISYYCERLCPLTVTSRHNTSPFYSLILPFSAAASGIVSDALLALSARHLSRTDNAWATTAVRLESKVLRELRHRLAIAEPSEIWQDHELPVVMMLMCLYEILNRCDQRWVVHLKGARDLVLARRTISGRLSSQRDSVNELTQFAEKFFAFQDVIGRTACGQPPIFGSDYWDIEDDTIDPWLGCSPSLVAIVCSVTELNQSRSRTYNSTASQDFASQVAALEASLSAVHQIVRTDTDDELLLRSAETKQLASWVYLHCALYGASPRTPIVKQGVRRVLQQISRFLDEDVAAGLLWPLFVAAVELDPLENEVWKNETTGAPVYGRALVLRILEHMSTTSIANVTRTRDVICKIWQARDLAMTGDDPSLSTFDDDWDRFVAPMSINISLA